VRDKRIVGGNRGFKRKWERDPIVYPLRLIKHQEAVQLLQPRKYRGYRYYFELAQEFGVVLVGKVVVDEAALR
jgi:hypothetical protein